jgi:hypothetical protein
MKAPNIENKLKKRQIGTFGAILFILNIKCEESDDCYYVMNTQLCINLYFALRRLSD